MNASPSDPTATPLPSASERSELDRAFAALAEYDSGSSRGALLPIDEAVKAALKDERARSVLETRLTFVLTSKVPSVAKAYACRKLATMGGAACVPGLAALLREEGHVDMALSALEVIPDPAAATALRQALSELQGRARIGVINTLGMKTDAASVAALGRLLKADDGEIAGAAGAALGNIGTMEAARALRAKQASGPKAIRLSVAHACLACAERLASTKQPQAAADLYEPLTETSYPEPIRAAAARGLAVLSKAR